MKVPRSRSKAKAHIVHRHGTNGQHRIEVHAAGQSPTVGKWVPYEAIAQLKALRATTAYFGEVLPRVFRASTQEMETVVD